MRNIVRLFTALAALSVLAGCSVYNQVAEKVSTGAGSIFRGGVRTYTFYNLPENVQDLQALPESNRKDAYGVAAMTIAALCRYETNPEECFKMIDWLKGDEALTANETEFLKERLQGMGYKPRSYLAGATPEYGYTPSMPYKFTPVSNPYTFQEDGWAVISLRSSGTASLRQLKLRQKKSTGEWFLNDIQCLNDIKAPVTGK